MPAAETTYPDPRDVTALVVFFNTKEQDGPEVATAHLVMGFPATGDIANLSETSSLALTALHELGVSDCLVMPESNFTSWDCDIDSLKFWLAVNRFQGSRDAADIPSCTCLCGYLPTGPNNGRKDAGMCA